MFIKKYWRPINGFLLVLGLATILYITLFKRTTGEYGSSLVPFISFRLAQVNSEYYRTMLLNCLMFVPFGLGLSVRLNAPLKMVHRSTFALMTSFFVTFTFFYWTNSILLSFLPYYYSHLLHDRRKLNKGNV